MILHRFVVGPERLRVPYGDGFVERLRPALETFFEAYGKWPNACYVSVRFPGGLPMPMFLDDGPEGDAVRFYRQTLLGDDEILLGVEIETEWGGDDGQFNERAVG